MTGPLIIHSYESLFPRGPPIYKSFKIAIEGLCCILAVDDSYLFYVFLPPDRLHTRVVLSFLAITMSPVAMVLVPPLPHNSPRLASDLYLAPSSCTLYTILPPGLLGEVPIPILTSPFPNTSFVSMLGFVELPTPSIVTKFRATSSLSPVLQPGLRSFFVSKPSSDVVLTMP